MTTPSTPTPRFQVDQTGSGFLPVGNWYWTRLGPDGLPSEPINSHGPFFLKCLAVGAAERATGGNG